MTLILSFVCVYMCVRMCACLSWKSEYFRYLSVSFINRIHEHKKHLIPNNFSNELVIHKNPLNNNFDLNYTKLIKQ